MKSEFSQILPLPLLLVILLGCAFPDYLVRDFSPGSEIYVRTGQMMFAWEKGKRNYITGRASSYRRVEYHYLRGNTKQAFILKRTEIYSGVKESQRDTLALELDLQGRGTLEGFLLRFIELDFNGTRFVVVSPPKDLKL
jgi:hypothetical protein